VSAWDDHKYVRPEPGSSWTILPGGAALFTVTPQAGSQWDVSDRASRQLGQAQISVLPGATLIPEESELLVTLKQIRTVLGLIYAEFNSRGVDLAALGEGEIVN
jgi:hypothetical protein